MKFEIVETGGGFTAWRLDFPGTDWYVLITQGLSHELDFNEPVEIGIYKDERTILYFEVKLNNICFE